MRIVYLIYFGKVIFEFNYFQSKNYGGNDNEFIYRTYMVSGYWLLVLQKLLFYESQKNYQEAF
jgi:hypothetical protein